MKTIILIMTTTWNWPRFPSKLLGTENFFLFFLFRAALVYMEVARLGVKSELQLLDYTTAVATQDLSHICKLHHSSLQHRILNPPSKARDWTHILMDTSQVLNPLSHYGNSGPWLFSAWNNLHAKKTFDKFSPQRWLLSLTFMNGISALIKVISQNSPTLSSTWGYKTSVILRTTLIWPFWLPDLRLPDSRTVRNEFLLFMSLSICAILLKQPRQAKRIYFQDSPDLSWPLQGVSI